MSEMTSFQMITFKNVGINGYKFLILRKICSQYKSDVLKFKRNDYPYYFFFYSYYLFKKKTHTQRIFCQRVSHMSLRLYTGI